MLLYTAVVFVSVGFLPDSWDVFQRKMLKLMLHIVGSNLVVSISSSYRLYIIGDDIVACEEGG